ncbi:hypothetical protein N8684_00230 [bacterium]|jgi:hypothetical protein|nr:hypothetical protein [bacterium]
MKKENSGYLMFITMITRRRLRLGALGRFGVQPNLITGKSGYQIRLPSKTNTTATGAFGAML